MKVWSMCVDLSNYRRYLNQILYRAQAPHYAWRNVPDLHDLKIQDGGRRRLGFRKMSITPNWIELFAQNLVGRCITATRRWHITKTRNRNFFCVTSLLWWIKMYILNNVGNLIGALMSRPRRALNLQILCLSLCRTHLFALLSRLLICHTSPTNKLY